MKIDTLSFTHFLANTALEKKANNIVILDVKDISSYADYFIICDGSSTRQVQAISEWLEFQSKSIGRKPISVEGNRSGKWVLIDFGAVVVHVFYEQVRAFYDLEGLWMDARNVPFDSGNDDRSEINNFEN